MYPSSADASKPGMDNPWAPKKKTGFLFGDPSTFGAAVSQQGSDYDAIMKHYRDLAQNFSNNPLSTSPISPSSPLTPRKMNNNPLNSGDPITSSPLTYGNPLTYDAVKSAAINKPNPIGFDPLNAKTSEYKQSDDVTGALSRLKDLSDTGGYTPEGIQNIRERNVSPIRSIYSSGKQNLERQRSLSGGYSPNFNAVSAMMARDQADKIGDITTRTNAGIAQNVASNRLQAAPQYASASARANEAKTAADQRNADIINEINKYNTGTKANIDEFNTSTGLGVDKYNRDTQLGIDLGNRDTRLNVDKYNKDRQLDIDRDNRNTKLGLDIGNRDTRLGVDKYNQGLERSDRDFQFGVDSSNRDAKFNTDRLNNENVFRGKQADIQAILDAIRGQSSLYGTTPALTSLFGNQVMQANQAGQGQQDINNRRRQIAIGASRG